ncbi:type II secretion system protein M [Pseudomonas sp. 5P_3.1_Bac2]|uniref:type II secretion system protein M n=1 Tax=Pseudomonas sp. 5P_3.1_Bac2 TaxID=2971617 RepID=UPI0021C65491|nr:type II secretion system protein M [Pseudomonas sp. 5P_3.1_Bac2]MCU1717740.1 type II secretion system protein M [Pseudomonas sp. 5P_3.1_Bac2]
MPSLPLKALWHNPKLRAYRARAGSQWQALAKREQLALQGLAGFLLLCSTYSLLWQPLQQGLYAAQQNWRNASLQHSQLLQLPLDASEAQEGVSASNLPSVVARSGQQAGLNLQRMDREAPGRLSLALEGHLGSLITWLDQLEQQQVQVLSLSLEVSPEGVANVQLQVQAP